MAYTAAQDDMRTSGAANENTALDSDGFVEIAHRAGQRLGSALGSAYTNTSETLDGVTREIRRRPVQSSIIALGLGYVLASILRR